jgi:hypothetical protein
LRLNLSPWDARSLAYKRKLILKKRLLAAGGKSWDVHAARMHSSPLGVNKSTSRSLTHSIGAACHAMPRRHESAASAHTDFSALSSSAGQDF